MWFRNPKECRPNANAIEPFYRLLEPFNGLRIILSTGIINCEDKLNF